MSTSPRLDQTWEEDLAEQEVEVAEEVVEEEKISSTDHQEISTETTTINHSTEVHPEMREIVSEAQFQEATMTSMWDHREAAEEAEITDRTCTTMDHPLPDTTKVHSGMDQLQEEAADTTMMSTTNSIQLITTVQTWTMDHLATSMPHHPSEVVEAEIQEAQETITQTSIQEEEVHHSEVWEATEECAVEKEEDHQEKTEFQETDLKMRTDSWTTA